MTNTNRRNMLRVGLACVALPSTLLHLGCAAGSGDQASKKNETPDDSNDAVDQNQKGTSMKIQYLEIVTSEVDAICETYSQVHDVEFGEKDQSLGGARTAKLASGGMVGVRAPMHDAEKPVTRNYILVEDIKTAVDAAAKTGAKVAVPPMALGTHGTCAVLIQGGIEFGFWQL